MLIATLLVPAVPAAAAPSVGGKRAEAQRVQSQLEALDDQVEAASDDYQEAVARYNAVSRKATRAQGEVIRLRARIRGLQTRLSGRVEGMYRSGPLSFLDVLLGARDFEQFATTWDVLTSMNRREAEDVRDLKIARAREARAQRELEQARRQARTDLGVMRDRKQVIDARFHARERMLAGLEGEIAALEREQRAARLAAAQAAAAQETRAQTRRRKSIISSIFGGGDRAPSPSREPRGGVVDIAMRYLGRPYRWGASGPDAFDCSGFTMYVYSRVGVSLPHSSRAQIGSGQRVSRDDLRPGDLVFFGRSRIHHVGIYIGGGRYIHSPHSGDVVSIDGLGGRGDYAGASRP